MRVTQQTFYNNFLYNHTRDVSQLNRVQTQLATGMKIQKMEDNPIIYTKFLSLNEEVNSLKQVHSSATFAQTFANNTDTTMNDMVSTLDSFKVKLLQASNDTQNTTSREAIVSDLKGMLAHLKDLANTSLDGKYMFSGSAFGTKPIDDNFKYRGNGENVKAFLGKNVEREYNIDGKSLFLGRDSDYKKEVTFNVFQFDKMKQNPQFVVEKDGKLYVDKDLKKHNQEPASDDVPVDEAITGDSEIRRLTGVNDIYDAATDTYKDGTSYFYLKGKKPNGDNFSTKFSLSNSAKTSELLDRIGEAFGNTATNRVVDVSMNKMGEIEITDSQSGKMITDFFMVASDKNEDSMQDLVKNGDYIVKFQESNFKGTKSLNSITANNGYFDNRIFKFGSKLFLDDNSREAVESDTLDKVFGQGLTEDNRISTPQFIHITGTDPDGNAVDDTFDIYDSSGNPKKVDDLLNEIKTAFGGDDKVGVNLENGEIIVNDKTLDNKNDSSNLSLNLTAYEDTDKNGSLDIASDKKIDIFRSKDLANENENYLEKSGNYLQSNVSQIIKDRTIYYKNGEKLTQVNKTQEYAKNDTVLMDTIGDESLPKEIKLDFKDVDGNYKKAKIELRDSMKSMTATYVANSDNKIVYDASENSNIKDNYYNTVGSNVIDKDGNKVKVEYLKVSDGSTTDTIAIDENTTFEDIVNGTSLLSDYKNGKFTTSNANVTITLEDGDQNDIVAGFKSNYQIDLNNDGKISYGEVFNIFNENGDLTPAHTQINTVSELDPVTCKLCERDKVEQGVTYKQLGDVVSMLTSKDIASNSTDVYSKNIETARSKVDVNLDDRGRLNVEDKVSTPSKVELAMYGTSISSSTFNSIGDSVNNSGSDQTFKVTVDGTDYTMNVTDGESVKSFINDINSGELKDSSGNSLDVKSSFKDGNIYLDFTNVKGDFIIDDTNLETHFKWRNDNSFSVNSNNAITVDEPQTDFFDTLLNAIKAVENGQNDPNSESGNPRNYGIQGAIKAIDHVIDHVRRMHAKIGAVGNEFNMTIERTETLQVNVQQLQSQNIDTDIAKASMDLNNLNTSYQALLASISKINKVSLLNYL